MTDTHTLIPMGAGEPETFRCRIYGVTEDPEAESAEERRRGRMVPRDVTIELMGKQERLRTPLPFRDLLLGIARTAVGEQAA